MKTPQNFSADVLAPAIDRSIAKLLAERSALRSKYSKLYPAALILTFAGILLLVAGNAFFPAAGIVLSAASGAILLLAAILALTGASLQTKFYLKNRPLSELNDVVFGLKNAGFFYGNHKSYFGRWIFEEQNGDRFAIVDPAAPMQPLLVAPGAAITLNLDKKLSFAARVGLSAPDARKFRVHPDFRFRDKKRPVYEQAELRIATDTDAPLSLVFPFGNANRRCFLQLIGDLCN